MQLQRLAYSSNHDYSLTLRHEGNLHQRPPLCVVLVAYEHKEVARPGVDFELDLRSFRDRYSPLHGFPLHSLQQHRCVFSLTGFWEVKILRGESVWAGGELGKRMLYLNSYKVLQQYVVYVVNSTELYTNTPRTIAY